MRKLKTEDTLRAVVLGLLTSVAGTLIVLVLQSHQQGSGARAPLLTAVLHFFSTHHARINPVAASFGILIYLLIAAKSSGRQKAAFLIWTAAWLVQMYSVLLRTRSHPVPVHELTSDTVANALSTFALLLGALVLRRRTSWQFLLLLFLPFIALLFDTRALSTPLAMVTGAILTYFALAILDEFRVQSWVPAYFAYYCYSTYAAIQILYPLDRYLESLVNNDQKEPLWTIVKTMGYTIGSFAKLGGAVAMLLIYVDAVRRTPDSAPQQTRRRAKRMQPPARKARRG